MQRPPAPELSTAAAAAWRAVAAPWWLTRAVLVVGWLAALLAALIGDDRACTAADPTVCGPDRTFAVATVFLVATPVLLGTGWAALGCLSGAVFGGFDLVYDPTPVGRVAFTVHGLACLLVLGWVLLGRRRQQRLAGALAAPVDLSRRRVGPSAGLRLEVVVAAVLLGALGIAGITWYRHQQVDLDAHLAAAATVPAEVTRVDGEAVALGLRLPDGRTVTLDVQDTGPYRVGRTVPVLVDPAPEPGAGTSSAGSATTGGAGAAGTPWVVLVAEPPDLTGWLLGGLLAIAGMLLLVWHEAQGWSARRRLFDGPLLALEVLVRPDARGRAELFPVGADPVRELPWARVSARVVEDDAWPVPPAQAEHDAVPPDPWTPREHLEPSRGCLVGDLREAGWVLLVTDDDLLVPTGPLRPVHPPLTGPDGPWARLVRRPARRRSASADAQEPAAGGRRHRRGGDDEIPGAAGTPVEVDPEVVVPDRPLRLRLPRRVRLVSAVALAGLVAGPALLSAGLTHSAFQVLFVLVLGAQFGVAGWSRWRLQARVDRDGVTFRVVHRVHRVPWTAVTGLRTDRERLAVAWVSADAHEILEFGPFDPRELPELAGPGPSGAPADPVELTRRVGSVLESLRAAAPRGDREASTHWSVPAVVLAGGYVVVAVVVALVALR